MMTNENFIAIEQFLKSKKLSDVLFTEVFDHFVMQISDLMLRNDMGFQEAFLQTRKSWQDELEMINADFLSFTKVPRIEKRILQRRFNAMMFRASVISVLAGFIFYFELDAFWGVQILLLSVYFLLLGYNFIFKKMNFFIYQAISFHPLLLRNLIIALMFFPITFLLGKNLWESVCNHMILVFGISLQIQLLYFRTKKVNILLS